MPKDMKARGLKNLSILQMSDWDKNRYFIEKMRDKHPQLIKGLNDKNSNIPAYMVFQSQDPDNCYLREDLKEVKALSFRENYSKELQRPKSLLKEVDNEIEKVEEIEIKDVDGTTFFETKYFMNEKMIEEYEKEKDPEFHKRALMANGPVQINKKNTRELKYV